MTGTAARLTTAHIRRFETTVRVPGEATGGAMAVLEHRLPAGVLAMPRHAHAAAESIVVLAGELRVELAGTVHVLGAGDTVVVPPDAPHTFWVDPDVGEPAIFIATVAPAGLERYYADVSAAITPGAAIEMEPISAAGVRHGVRVEMESLFELIERHTVQLS